MFNLLYKLIKIILLTKIFSENVDKIILLGFKVNDMSFTHYCFKFIVKAKFIPYYIKLHGRIFKKKT